MLSPWSEGELTSKICESASGFVARTTVLIGHAMPIPEILCLDQRLD
jgi:hypothetical protein